LDSVLRLFLTSLRKHPTHVALASFPSGDRVWLQNSSEAHLAPPLTPRPPTFSECRQGLLDSIFCQTGDPFAVRYIVV